MPTSEVPNYKIDYHPVGGSLSTEFLENVPQTEDDEGNSIFELCLEVGPVFRDPVTNDAIAFPYSVNTGGSCSAHGECEFIFPEEEYFLTVAVNPVGSGTASNITGTPAPYAPGTSIILTASANPGFVFVNWTNGATVISTVPNFTYAMPGETTNLVANFTPIDVDPEEPTEDNEPEIPTPVVNGTFLPNTYENCAVFLLIKDLPYNLPVGSVLNTALFDGLDWTYIREPRDWDTVRLKTERTENYGFTQTASVDAISFSCYSGKEFIDNIWIQGGADSNVKFIFAIQSFGSDDFIIALINDINFSEYTRDRDTTKINLEGSEFNQLLTSREDVPYLYPRALPVFMYSKALPQVTQYTRKTTRLYEDVGSKPTDLSTIVAGFGVFNSDPNLNEIEGAFTYPDQLTFVKPSKEDKYVMKPKFPGKYQVEIKVSAVGIDLERWIIETFGLGTPGVFNIPDPDGPSFGEATLKLVVEVIDAVTGTVKFEEVSDPTNFQSWLQTIWYRPDGTEFPLRFVRSQEFEKSYQFELTSNDEVYIYIRYQAPLDSPGPTIAYRNDNAFLKVFESTNTDSDEEGFVPSEYRPFSATDPVIKLSGLTIAKASLAYQGRLFDAMNSVLKKLAEKSRNVLVSNFLNEGGALHSLTVGNGFSIRGAAEVGGPTDSRASFKTLFNGARCLVNLGYNVEVNEDGREVVRVEEMDYFFTNKEIITFTEESEILSYVEGADMDFVFNEVEVGYQKFSKERETDKGDTLQDTHGKINFLTPIRKHKNKLSIISQFIASSFELERIRRKQFEPDSQNSNERYDNDVYMINLRQEDQAVGVINGIQDFFSEPNFVDFLIESNGFRFLNRTNLPLVQGDTVEILYNGISAGYRTIKEVLNAPQGIGSTAYDTYVIFTQPPPEPAPSPQIELVILLPSTRYIPESIEPFEQVNNLESPETHYNLRYTPKRMLKNWGKVINAGLSFKSGDEDIKFQDGEGNMLLETELSIDDPFPLGDIQRDLTKEGADITLSQVWGRNTRFIAYYVSWEVYLGYDVYNYIQKALKGNSADDNNYGYIQVPDFKGNLVRGVPVNLEYDPNKRIASFRIRFSQRLPILEADILRPIVNSLGQTFVDENGNYIQHD